MQREGWETERGREGEQQRAADRGRPSKRRLSAVHSSPDTLQGESGRKRVPIKNGERKRRRGVGGGVRRSGGKSHAGSLSGPAERQ